MECALHAGTTANATCSTCGKAACEVCLGSGKSCPDCKSEFGAALLTLIGVGYLAALAIGVIVFRGRPFIGGLAAIVAIALGRAVQIFQQRRAS